MSSRSIPRGSETSSTLRPKKPAGARACPSATASASPRIAPGQSYVATVVHAEIDDDGTIRVPEVTTAVDCGLYVNPERIRSQLEGAAVMGMSNALYSGITFKNGAVEQSNFTDYNVARMSNYPKKVSVHIVDAPHGTHSGGIGEPAVAPMIAALCNAVFAASKKRLRSLPAGDKIA